jgi:hypothetical protein
MNLSTAKMGRTSKSNGRQLEAVRRVARRKEQNKDEVDLLTN